MDSLRNFGLSLESQGLTLDGLCGVLPSLRPRTSGPHPAGHGVLGLGGNGVTTPSTLDTMTGVHHSSNIISFFPAVPPVTHGQSSCPFTNSSARMGNGLILPALPQTVPFT